MRRAVKPSRKGWAVKASARELFVLIGTFYGRPLYATTPLHDFLFGNIFKLYPVDADTARIGAAVTNPNRDGAHAFRQSDVFGL